MIIEVRSLYCEKCSVIRPIYFTASISLLLFHCFYFTASISLLLFHCICFTSSISLHVFYLIARYFNVISANIDQCSQNTYYEAMKKLGVVLNFGWGL